MILSEGSVVLGGVRALIWDLDETLIGSFDLFAGIIEGLATKFNLSKPDREKMLCNYHGTLEDTLKNCLDLHDEQVMTDVFAEFKIQQQLHYEDDIDKHYYQDAVELVHRANKLGLPQAVVTNRAHEGRGSASPHSIVGDSQINGFIDEIRCIDQVEFPKPDPRSIQDWLDKHDIKPSEVLVIGDQHVDARLAINLGGRAVLVVRNGGIPHLETLGDDIKNHVFLLNSLHNLELNTTL